MTPTETKAPLPDEVEKALARAARNIGWLEALPPYGDNDTRKAAADDMCRALEELRAHIAALEADNKRLREALLKIARTEHCSYDGNRPFISDHDSGYALGVADGHRLAANWARAALAQTDGKAGER